MPHKSPFAIGLVLLLCFSVLAGAASPGAGMAVASVPGAQPASAPPTTGGPDAFGYTYDANAPYSWVDASGGVTIAGGDDWCRGPFPLGFTFHYYGIGYTQFWITTNGQVIFSSTGQPPGDRSWRNTFIPSENVPHNFVAPFWGDLNARSGAVIRYRLFGSAPNRYLVVEWNRVTVSLDPLHPVTFEAILYEGSNDIKFQYLNMPANSRGDGRSASIGIENGDGKVGLQYSFNQEGAVRDGLAILFPYPSALPTPTGGPVPLRGGPDAFGYTWDRSVAFDWIDASDGTSAPWLTIGPYPIGFPFSFYGMSYTQFYLGMGLIQFGVGRSCTYNNICLPSVGIPNSFAAAFWDLVGSYQWTDAVFYKTVGTAPQRRLVVEWHNAQRLRDGRYMTFEMVLYEGSNDIRFQYLSMLANSYGDGRSATVGIENQSGQIGLQVACNQAWITDRSAVHFSFPAARQTPTPQPSPTGTRPAPGARRAYLPVLLRESVGPLSIALGQTNIESGLYLDDGGDTDTEAVTAGDPPLEARRTGNLRALPSPDGNDIADNCLQLRVDDGAIYSGWPTNRVRVEIEYLDQGRDGFELQYDATNGGPFDDGRFKTAGAVTKTNSGRWRTVVFTLCDAYFANRDNGGDMRIVDWGDGAETIRRVTVTLLSPALCP